MLYDAVWAVWCCAITVRWIMMNPWLPFAHNSCILLHTAAYCFNVSMSEDFTTFHDFPRLPSWLPSRLVHDYHDFHDFHDLIQFDASRPRRRRRPLEAPTLAQSSSCETSPRRRRSAHRICGEEATTKQRRSNVQNDSPQCRAGWDRHDVQVAVFELLAPKSPKHHRKSCAQRSSEKFLELFCLKFKGPKQFSKHKSSKEANVWKENMENDSNLNGIRFETPWLWCSDAVPADSEEESEVASGPCRRFCLW